jgi:hypothetical protein
MRERRHSFYMGGDSVTVAHGAPISGGGSTPTSPLHKIDPRERFARYDKEHAWQERNPKLVNLPYPKERGR